MFPKGCETKPRVFVEHLDLDPFVMFQFEWMPGHPHFIGIMYAQTVALFFTLMALSDELSRGFSDELSNEDEVLFPMS